MEAIPYDKSCPTFYRLFPSPLNSMNWRLPPCLHKLNCMTKKPLSCSQLTRSRIWANSRNIIRLITFSIQTKINLILRLKSTTAFLQQTSVNVLHDLSVEMVWCLNGHVVCLSRCQGRTGVGGSRHHEIKNLKAI